MREYWLDALHQVADFYFQSIGHDFQSPQSHALRAAFDAVHVRPIQARTFGKLVLSETLLLAKLLNLQSDDGLWVLQSPSVWNGYRLTFTDASAFSFLMDLYEGGRMRFTELDAWLRQHATAE